MLWLCVCGSFGKLVLWVVQHLALIYIRFSYYYLLKFIQVLHGCGHMEMITWQSVLDWCFKLMDSKNPNIMGMIVDFNDIGLFCSI
jgi:hypothetical protein